jgi:hypothetical protein
MRTQCDVQNVLANPIMRVMQQHMLAGILRHLRQLGFVRQSSGQDLGEPIAFHRIDIDMNIIEQRLILPIDGGGLMIGTERQRLAS